MEKIDTLLPTLVPTFLVLIWAAVVFAIVVGCAGLIAGLVHVNRDKSLQRRLQELWVNARAYGEVVRSYKDAGVDPSVAPIYLPAPVMDSPEKKGLTIIKNVSLGVIAVCLLALTAKLYIL